MSDGLEMIHRDAIGGALDEVLVAGLLNQTCDAVHRPIERALLPMIAVRGAVLHTSYAMRVRHELKSVGALGTQGALVDGAIGVALDIDYFAALCIDVLAAPNRAVWADAVRLGGAAKPRVLGGSVRAHGD